ncbi:hypothetical protein [Paenibacillus sp. sgz302251]|uniref:hypothetical protein n=1 Tax=Paenibacillus sp. sgz302251 TaxID=3414493 RepID=UPI003C7D058A
MNDMKAVHSAYIAGGTGLHRNTVENYIKSLEEIGLIKVIRGDSIHNGEYGEFKREINNYRINHDFNAFTYYYNTRTFTNEGKFEQSRVEPKQVLKVVSNKSFFEMSDDLSWLYD